jgi:hypothetical protein
MTIQTSFSASDLVLRLTNGPQDGEFIQVNTQKCYLGTTNKQTSKPTCAIFRGPDGVAVRTYSDDVRVNGEAVSVHWLKEGDRIELPNSISAEVTQLGQFGTDSAPQEEANCMTGLQEDTSNSSASLSSDTEEKIIYSVQEEETETETLPTATAEPAEEEVFVTQDLNTFENAQQSAQQDADETRYEADSEETILGYQPAEPTVEAENVEVQNVEVQNVEVQNVEAEAPTEEQPQDNAPESTAPESDQAEIDARLADLERVFGTATSQGATPEDQTPAPAPVEQPEAPSYEEQLLALQNTLEPEEAPAAEETSGENAFDLTASSTTDETNAAQSTSFIDDLQSFEDEPMADSEVNQTSTEALESRLDQLTNAINESQNTQPTADELSGSSFEQPTHSQNELTSSFANTPSSLPESSLASQLINEVELEANTQPETETEPAVEEPAQREPAAESTPAPAESGSLQDILARMKSNGDWDGIPDESSPMASTEPTPETTVTPVEAPAPVVAAPAVPETEADVEDYMSQLLTRMRGGEAAPAPQQKAEEKLEEKTKTEEPEFVAPADPLKPEEFVPKAKAQKPKSFDAMRELANSSARTAVNRSEFERSKALAIVQLGIAIGSFILALYYIFVGAAGMGDLQAMIGYVCIIVSGFFAYRCFKTNELSKVMTVQKVEEDVVED